MNKQDLIKALAAKLNCTLGQSEKSLNALLQIIQETLKQGDEIKLLGFGRFKTYDFPAKEIINPRGKKMSLPAVKRAKFVVGKRLKDAINTKM